MTPNEFAKQQRDFLIRNEKQSALVILREFESLKSEIEDYLTTNLTGKITVDQVQKNQFLEQTLNKLESEVTRIINPMARIITRGQQRVINFASQSLQKFLELKTSIFAPDQEAVQKLIGRTQDGSTLTKFFERLKPTVREKAKETLIKGFSSGESTQLIAKRLSDVTDITRYRALTISRTEQNEAYRAATRDFYATADIREYFWMSVLDPRTCIICWYLHGQKFKTSRKVFSHPNCRCVLVPDVGQKIKTGAEIFASLQSGFKKEILGKGGFEKYQAGFKLNDFVGIKNTNDGLAYYRRPLGEITEDLHLHPVRSIGESENLAKKLGVKEVDFSQDFANRREKVADYIVSGLEELKQRFPKYGMPEKLRFVSDAPDPNYQAWFNSRENSLNINIKHFIWNDIDYWMEEYRSKNFHSTSERFHLITHEYAHYFHYKFDSIALKKIKLLADEVRLIGQEVSNYACFDSSEFVAEVFTGIFFGKKYSNAIMDIYEKYGGLIPK